MTLVCAPMYEKPSPSLKFITLIVPSINTESISPMKKRCHLSLFSNSLSRLHLPDQLVATKRSSYFLSLFLSFDFSSHTFCEHKSLGEPLGYKFYIKFTSNTLFKHTLVCLKTLLYIFHSNLGQCCFTMYTLKVQQVLA